MSNNLLRIIEPSDLARLCGFRIDSTGGPINPDDKTPAPWGIASAIRREVRRRSIVTRRELRLRLEPLVQASGFGDDAWTHIRQVADELVQIGELQELHVDHQRGYAAQTARWVRLSETSAAILGVMETCYDRLEPEHPLQYVRRFDPRDSEAVQALAERGIYEQTLEQWGGRPDWHQSTQEDRLPGTLSGLWSWYIDRLETAGAPLAPSDTVVQAVAPKPGDFFQVPPESNSGRWTSPAILPHGVYLGAQPGYNERHWKPLLIEVSEANSRSLFLDSGTEHETHWDLFCWLLMARGTSYPEREQIRVDCRKDLLQLTFPIPKHKQRLLKLYGESLGRWAYHIPDLVTKRDDLREQFPAVQWIDD